MSEISNFRDAEDKLRALCEENDLDYEINFDSYPPRLTIKPMDESQMSMFAPPASGSGGISLVFFYNAGDLQYRLSARNISDALFNKFKKLFKDLYFAYLQWFHRQVCQNGSLPDMKAVSPSTEALDATELKDEGDGDE